MMDENCIFCKLANGVFPTNSIYEDEDFNVILDIAPATKGHAIILPKEHYKNIYELPEDLAAKAMVLAKKMATHMTEKLNCDGFNLLQNNNEVAGQTVFHFHIHYCICRFHHLRNSQRISRKFQSSCSFVSFKASFALIIYFYLLNIVFLY